MDVPRGSFWLPVCLLFGLLVAYSLLRVPIPGVNEPHYLGKAKQFWNPDWCAGDLFLTSSSPHLVFYVAFGWLTRYTTLETAALVGRCLGLLILAIGWQRLSIPLTGRIWGSVPALAILLLLHSLGNWSGEWLVGGIESKVVSYGFLFWAIGAGLQRRLIEAGLTAGLAVSLHPVVGGWGIVAAVLATTSATWLLRPTRSDESYSRRTCLTAGGIFLAAALPGIIPAVTAISVNDPAMERTANLLQVANRLAHHLDPMTFPKTAYRYFGLLIVLWLLLLNGRTGYERRRNEESQLPAVPDDSRDADEQIRRNGWWVCFVLSAVLIALIGVLIGWGPRPMKTMPGYEWRIRLLKFYPFRLADAVVPIAIGMAAAVRLIQCRGRGSARLMGMARSDESGAPFSRRMLIPTITLAAFMAALLIPGPDQNPSRMTPAQLAAWIATLAWIDEHAPNDALIYSVDDDWAVKWYAQRAEYVNYKDAPQDAPSLLEWNRRLWVIARWKQSALADGRVSREELADLHRQTGIDYLICRRFSPIAATPAFTRETFRVYRLPPDHE